MAELAAKIRARFKRRPSAIPSLLSSRSTGSHTSSSHRSHNADHQHHQHHHLLADPEPDQDPDSKSRAGSCSRVSVILDQDDDDEGSGPPPQPQPQPGRDLCCPPAQAAPEMVGHPGLAQGEGEGEVESKGEEGLAGDGSQPPPDQHDHHQSEPDNTSPISPAQHDSSTGHQAQNAQNAQHASSLSSSPDTLKPTAPTPAPAPALEEASPGSVLAGPPEPPALAVESEPESEQPAPAPAPAPEPEPASEPEPSSSEAPTATATASVMPGNDLHPSPRKLSCISEHPSPDHQELLPKPNPITAHPAQPPITGPAASADATSVLPPKPDDAGDKPAAAAAPPPPRTPKLASVATQRPFHIPLPVAAVVPPSAANLSPNAAYSPKGTVTPSSPLARNSSVSSRPAPVRRQSLLSNRQSTLIQTLLRGSQGDENASISNEQLLPISGNMVMRKIWVKRPGASATLVTINEDDLVDDVRDMILRKYANSLGRQFDAPDLTLRIRPNGNQQERMLGPEEPMSRTLDAYFPSGQTVDDALIIDVPLRRTPRASPRSGPPHAPHVQYYVEEARPSEAGNDYFGPGAISTLPVTVTAPSNGTAPQHAISILQTGHPPQIPSPGGTRARTYRERPERPRLGRQHTSSPTLINMASGTTHQASIATTAGVPHDQSQAAPAPPAISTPPAPEGTAASQRSATPPPRVSSPRPKASKKKKAVEHPSLPKGMLNGSVPPINVLIVEDNIINLKLLEAFVKRLKVRWSTAMNGRDAVTKWRGGGFHLVLMDIQLPVMSGLDATREIRRLERVNSIGVFSSAADAPPEVKGEPDEKDKLENMDLFKSPVIIVALTASSLQSDRHEALAAGCNDFLTKPVNFVWLERKVMEWGCMQALIDFDGWRKWKDFSAKLEEDRRSSSAVAAQKAKVKRNRSSMSHQAVAAGA
ncbi:response regulator-1 [Diaporthe eres]|uniref:Response regulatory domain-containing protein n=1 Tax=Diaporthe vaccinii TaxID=105482 RepID=A0ABR4FEL2_9PEZI|nr:response regulator-1 [Diaporthe eres]